MVELTRAGQRLVAQFLLVGESEPSREMRLGCEHGKPVGMHAHDAAEFFGIARLAQPVNVPIGSLIGLGHGFPGHRFSVTRALIADQPFHGIGGIRHLLANGVEGFGIGRLEHKRLDLPTQQGARLVAEGRRRSEIKATNITEREIAAIEHEIGVALAAIEGANAVEHGAHAGLVRRVEERHPFPKRRIGRQLGEVRGILLARGGELFIGVVAHLLQRNYGEAKHERHAPDNSAGQAR